MVRCGPCGGSGLVEEVRVLVVIFGEGGWGPPANTKFKQQFPEKVNSKKPKFRKHTKSTPTMTFNSKAQVVLTTNNVFRFW